MSSVELTIETIGSEISQCLGSLSTTDLNEVVEEISNAPRVFLLGAGRSALGIRGHAMRLMHFGKTAYMVGDVTTPAIAEHDLLIVGSGSGSTASLVTASQKAKKLGARLLLFTIDPDSPIGQLADCTVVIPAPSPKASPTSATLSSIQPMGSLFEQCLFITLDLIIVLLMKNKQISSEDMFTRHANIE